MQFVRMMQLSRGPTSALEPPKGGPLHCWSPLWLPGCRPPSQEPHWPMREQGTQMPLMEQSQPEGLHRSPRAAPWLALNTAASHGSLYCRGPGFWTLQFQIPGPTGHSLTADVHLITGRDTGIWWFDDHNSFLLPAIRGKVTPHISFKYWIGSMPQCRAHKCT